jgi:hypothetical protein
MMTTATAIRPAATATAVTAAETPNDETRVSKNHPAWSVYGAQLAQARAHDNHDAFLAVLAQNPNFRV